ncbi:MAG TPA: molybdenum ABC transporter ATP-binding protein [Longimicrobium sp.]|nr:molybdenum ABC transporter ATP-binding protein [Longimicrobium sp.]
MISLELTLPLEDFALEVALTPFERALAVVGQSGSGKTSLLEAIAGLRRRARGRIVLGERTLFDSARGVWVPPEHRRVGYVPQDVLLFPHLSARGNVRFGLRQGEGSERRFDEAVALLELAPLLDRAPGTLSGGERQRVALARALCAGPELLLLDEPLSALDPALKERVLPYLLRVRDEAKVPMLYVTHQPGEARVLAREVVVLERGRVRARGPVDEVLAAPRASGVAEGEGWRNVVEGVLEREGGGWALRTAGGLLLRVPEPRGAQMGERAAYAVPAEDVMLAGGPLEGLSARNVLPARVAGLDAWGDGVLVRLTSGGVELRAQVTAAAVEALGLRPGREVFLAVKAHSLRRV